MDPRNGKRSPGRGSGRRSSERQGRRCRTRSRTPIQRRRSSRYSPSRRRTRSRSLSPYRSKDLYHRNRRSSSSESRRRGNDDVRRPEFRGPENSKMLEKAERDRARIIVYRKLENENASYGSKSGTRRLTSRERNRVKSNGNGRRIERDRRWVYVGHSRYERDKRRVPNRSKYAGRRAYDRSSTSRDRSQSPVRRSHDSRRNSDGKNYGRDYNDYDRYNYDKLERPRGTGSKEQRINSSRGRGSKNHRSYEKYDDKKATFKRSKDISDNYSKSKEQESENNEGENCDGSDESYENEEGEHLAPTLPSADPNFMAGPFLPRHLVPRFMVAPHRPILSPRFPLPYLRPFGVAGPPLLRPHFILRPPYPPRLFAPILH